VGQRPAPPDPGGRRSPALAAGGDRQRGAWRWAVACPWTYALGVAEDYARRQQAGVLVDPSAAWRRQPPTDKQLALLRKWRVALPPDLTRGAAADLLTAVMGDWD